MSSSSDDEDVTDGSGVSRIGVRWTPQTSSNRPGPERERNVFRNAPGPTAYAKRHIYSGSVASAFRLIIDLAIMKIIKSCTEAEAARRGKVNWSVEYDELDAFFAIMFYRGLCGGKNFPLKMLWNVKWGAQRVKDIMSRNRFTEIMSYLRFDNKITRSQRLATDKFALISDVWNRFITNSQQAYVPEEELTIDEQLFPTKARCPFTQFMPQKPDKYGIKFFLMIEVLSKYVCNGFPYLGKDECRPPNQPLGEFVVLRLLEPYFNKGYNITCDNYFTSLPLAQQLVEKKTTLVGTMRLNRKELPPIVADTKSKPLFDTQVLVSAGITLTIYKAKPSKNVLILSSRHEIVKVADPNSQKKNPNTVVYYN